MNKSRLEEIIRVDHAGEHGATSIYKGTLDILNLFGDKETISIIQDMAEGEKKATILQAEGEAEAAAAVGAGRGLGPRDAVAVTIADLTREGGI